MNNLSNFQVILMGVIIGLIVLAMLVFSGVIPLGSKSGKPAPITIWGMFPGEKMAEALSKANNANKTLFSLTYSQKKENYEESFVDALASKSGPDILIITNEITLKNKDKFNLITFQTFSERAFKDAFIEEAELFLNKDGITAVPFAVDPIVLYWNRDLFNKAGLAEPPKFWDEFSGAAQALTQIDKAKNIIQSGVAMGEFSNIARAKEILSLMVLQSGNPIIAQDTMKVLFGETSTSNQINTAEGALRFYTDFSNPSKDFYSWNRGISNDREIFIGGKLAMYFGYASELQDIKESNPHLNFDVALVPQQRNFPIQATFGKIYAFAITKGTANPVAATQATFGLAKIEVAQEIAKKLGFVSVSREILSKGSGEPNLSVFYKSAVQAKGWLEPNTTKVSEIFKNMIESVSTGKKKVSEAVSDAKELLISELEKLQKN